MVIDVIFEWNNYVFRISR